MGKYVSTLEQLGLVLPPVSTPAGSYTPIVQTGSLLFVSGQLPMNGDGVQYVGRCGEDMAMADAAEAAKLCALNIVAQVQAFTGDLDKVVKVVKLNGYVNSTADFRDHPKVINGASDTMMAIFGDVGRHARAAVGVANLPFGASVEVEAIIEVAP